MGNDSGSLKGRVSASTWVECRICQEEDRARNMEVPCACSGSLKYAHSKCLRRWSKKKGDTMCELRYQRYKPKRGHQLDERTSRHLDVT